MQNAKKKIDTKLKRKSIKQKKIEPIETPYPLKTEVHYVKVKEKKPIFKRFFKFNCLFGCLFYFIIFLFIAVIISFVFFKYYVDGNTEFEKPKSFISSVKGDVFIHNINNQKIKAKTKMEISMDDRIVTGKNSFVSITIFDESIVHIDENSDIYFKELIIDNQNFLNKNVSIKVTAGKVWSRVLQLVDKDTGFEVESSNTVATVRGTTFDFIVYPDGKTEVTAIESEVKVSTFKRDSKNKKRKVIKDAYLTENMEIVIDENEGLEFDEDEAIRKITEEKLNDKRYIENLSKDADFQKELLEKRKKQINGRSGVLPGSGLYDIKKKKQDLISRIIQNEEQRKELKLKNLKIKLLEANALFVEGRFSESKEILDRVKKEKTELDEILMGEEKERLNEALKNQINMWYFMLRDFTSGTPEYDFKLYLEDFLKNYLSEEDKAFSDLKILEERINEEKILERRGEGDLCEEIQDAKKNLGSFKNDTEQFDKRLQFTLEKIKSIEINNCFEEKTPTNTASNNEKGLDENDGQDVVKSNENGEKENEKDKIATLMNLDKINVKKIDYKNYVNEVKETGDDKVNEFEAFVRKNPFKTIIFSIVAGVIASLLVIRRLKKKPVSPAA